LKSRILWLVFGLGAIVGAIVFLPAGLLAVAVEGLSDGRLVLAEARGRVWQGQGKLVLQMRPGAAMNLGDINWRISPSRLVVAELAVDLQQDIAGQRGSALLTVSPGGKRIRDADLRVPAALLADFSPAWAALTPAGWLRLQSHDFAFRAGEFVGEVQASWAPARFFGGVEAGAYHLALRGEAGARLAGTLSTQGGDIQASGQGNWQMKTGLQARVRLALQAGAENGRALPLFRALCAGVRQECEFNIQ